jgi:hypothetical protein
LEHAAVSDSGRGPPSSQIDTAFRPPQRIATGGIVYAASHANEPARPETRLSMDGVQLDAMARGMANAGGTRRWLLGGLAGISAVIAGHSADARKRCKKTRCGQGCCKRNQCFAKTVEPTTAEPTSFGCCPKARLCRSLESPDKDQCCYKAGNEYCKPDLPDTNPEAGICCRPCGVNCCNPEQECDEATSTCVIADTARLPRYRR